MTVSFFFVLVSKTKKKDFFVFILKLLLLLLFCKILLSLWMYFYCISFHEFETFHAGNENQTNAGVE